MILNGFSVVASLLERGEDSLLGRTEMALAFQLNKRDLVAARERTGCYSLTRYHLNAAAELLGIKPSDFVYRVSPSMLKADMSGSEAGAMGATGLDATKRYSANATTAVDTDALLMDLAGAAKGDDFVPEAVTNRFKVLKDIAKSQNGSFVAAQLTTMGESVFVRYNAGAITKLVFEELRDPDGTAESSRQAAALMHVILALYGAYSTGAALNMLRQFLSTGIITTYNELQDMRVWMRYAANIVAGSSIMLRPGTERPNARLERLFEAAYDATAMWTASPYLDQLKTTSGWTDRGRFSVMVLQNEMKKFVADFAGAMKTVHILPSGKDPSVLDIAALVKRTNKLLRSTPQLVAL